MGKRKIEIEQEIYLDSEDVTNINRGDHIRLMSLGNIKIDNVGPELKGQYVNDNMNVDYPKIHWVPQKNSHELKIMIPKVLFINEKFNEDSLEEIKVLTEPHYLKLKEGDEIQFIRFGYCRKESQNRAIYSHR